MGLSIARWWVQDIGRYTADWWSASIQHGSCGTWRTVMCQAAGAENGFTSGHTTATVRTAVEDAMLANAVRNADQTTLPTGWATFNYKA